MPTNLFSIWIEHHRRLIGTYCDRSIRLPPYISTRHAARVFSPRSAPPLSLAPHPNPGAAVVVSGPRPPPW
nr:unnamed protein product [Digitaria exilis]